jgi:hypothetical protein
MSSNTSQSRPECCGNHPLLLTPLRISSEFIGKIQTEEVNHMSMEKEVKKHGQPIEPNQRIGMNHDEQIEEAAYLAYQLWDAMETWEYHGITWDEMGRLLVRADAHYGTLKELIHQAFDAWADSARERRDDDNS